VRSRTVRPRLRWIAACAGVAYTVLMRPHLLTCAFVLVPFEASSSRLLARGRADYRPRAIGLLIPALLEAAHLLMERAILRSIGRRSDRSARGSPDGQGGLRR
jgi:hypothetical protein